MPTFSRLDGNDQTKRYILPPKSGTQFTKYKQRYEVMKDDNEHAKYGPQVSKDH